MPTREEVWKQVAVLRHKYIFWTRKEINYLPKILGQNEHILALTSGMMDSRTWLAVCTNARVLFLDCGMFFGLRQVQINLDRLQTIESDVGLFFGTIRVFDAGSSMSIAMVLKPSIAPFVRTVQEAMDLNKQRAFAAASTVTGQSSMLNELERLAKLKSDGHLSEQEYAMAKAKLLHS